MEKRVIFGIEEELLNNLKYSDCNICLQQVNSEGISNVLCPVEKINRRIGCKKSSKGYAQVCAEGLTARNFRIELQNVVDSIPQLMRFRKEPKIRRYFFNGLVLPSFETCLSVFSHTSA